MRKDNNKPAANTVKTSKPIQHSKIKHKKFQKP